MSGRGKLAGKLGRRACVPRGGVRAALAPARRRDDSSDKLVKLQKLHDDGVITDDEYRKARSRLLDEL